jgi:hypothetical protein
MISIPRRRRVPLEAAQAEANAALKQAVDGLHAEAVQLEAVRARTPGVQRLGQRFLHWQERNHFGPNMARVLGAPR